MDSIVMTLLVLIAICILLLVLFLATIIVHWMFDETPLPRLILFIILVWLAMYLFITQVSASLMGRF